MSIQNYSTARNGSVNINTFPRYTITAQIVETNQTTGLEEVLFDYTGVNAIDFPAELRNRTPTERDYIIEVLAMLLVRMKSGRWTP